MCVCVCQKVCVWCVVLSAGGEATEREAGEIDGCATCAVSAACACIARPCAVGAIFLLRPTHHGVGAPIRGNNVCIALGKVL